jgi:hypothetical protein
MVPRLAQRGMIPKMADFHSKPATVVRECESLDGAADRGG